MELKNQKKINLAFIICSLTFGGAERLVLDLIKNLDKNIFNIHLITIMGGGDLLPEFEKLNIQIKIFHKKTKLGLGVILKIKKYLIKEKIDLVHSHLFAGDTWGRLSAWLARVPIIISTEHNINLDEGKLKKIIKKIFSCFCQKIIAVSKQVKNYQIEVEKISANKIIVINNSLDLARFPFQPKPIKKDSTLILGVIGRLEPQKGHLVALRAAQQLENQGIKAQLIIKGRGSLKNYLVKKVAELNLKNVLWEEPEIEVSNFYQQLDFLIIPSLWEGFGLVALESMASGTPVIGSRVGGLTDFIKDNINGFLFTTGNHLALADLIKNLSQKYETLEKIKTEARLTVEQNFNLNKMTKQYQDLYLKLFYENTFNK